MKVFPKGPPKTLSRIFWFGKYKGEHIDKIYEEDPEYLGWCLDREIKFVMDNLTDEQQKECIMCFEEQENDYCDNDIDIRFQTFYGKD